MNTSICRKTHIRQMFLLVSGSQIYAPQRDTNVALSYKAIYILVKSFFLISCIRHIAKTLGEAFCTFIFLHFPHSGLSVLNRLHFYFWWHDSENRGLTTWTLSHKSSLQLLSYLAASLTYCILVFFTTRYRHLALFHTRCAFSALKWMWISIIVIWTLALNITS